jgi:hypothetical protein
MAKSSDLESVEYYEVVQPSCMNETCHDAYDEDLFSQGNIPQLHIKFLSLSSEPFTEIMADDPTNTPTVTFDVGGKIFKTSRSLILQHEGTLLARLVDAGHQDPTKPIFINRDGNTFRLVLNYIRYGCITLPITVSKEMFLLDMDFYSIAHKEGTVKTSTDEWGVQVSNQLDNIVTGMNRLDNIVTGMNMYELKKGKKDIMVLQDIRLLAVNIASLHHGRLGFNEWKAQCKDTVRKIRSLKSKLDSP